MYTTALGDLNMFKNALVVAGYGKSSNRSRILIKSYTCRSRKDAGARVFSVVNDKTDVEMYVNV